MKTKKILLALLLTTLSLFGFEISFNKKFSKQISPDKLSTYITITVNKEEEVEITPILDKFNKFISSEDEIEKKGGKFSIYPVYKYHKGNSTIIGYNGTLRYQILSLNSKTINAFIKQLLYLKDDSKVSISISSLNWIVSKLKYSQTIDELRLESIIWSKRYATKLSQEMNTVCKVNGVHINSRNFRPVYRSNKIVRSMSAAKTMSADVPVPKATKNEISLNPSYVLDCK